MATRNTATAAATGRRNEAQSYEAETHRRSGIVIMGRLIGLVVPLWPVMLLAIVLGVAGFLCAIFLTIVAGYEVLALTAGALGTSVVGQVPFFDALFDGLYYWVSQFASLLPDPPTASSDWTYANMMPGIVFGTLIVMGVLRGVFHYYEQYCNHYIAFRLLAIVRHKVFAALRRLCPAKLEGRDKGDLVSLITSDIELLEVFYAHTISPIAIAVIVCALMTWFMFSLLPAAGWLALVAYVVVGVVMPVIIGKAGKRPGLEFRNDFGDLNSFVLDSLRGIDETIQYGGGQVRLEELSARSTDLSRKQRRLNRIEAHQRSFTNLIILLFSLGMLGVTLYAYSAGECSFAQAVVATIAMMGSFGPALALSNLANTLNQTLACGDRVLDLLDEEPQVVEVEQGAHLFFDGAAAEHVTFGYGDERILDDFSMAVEPGRVIGVHGASGSGKSTLLKLFMRFWDVDSGRISYSGRDVRDVATASLRDNVSYVTQDTYLFHDTIANNIAIGRPGARRDEIVDAAQKASLHEFVVGLPDGYDTQVGELGDTLSGGERQRIGIARAFLHDAPLLLLDEPTSNLDSLNEGIILKSLSESLGHRTVVLVSHRASTMGIADEVYEMDSGRLS